MRKNRATKGRTPTAANTKGRSSRTKPRASDKPSKDPSNLKQYLTGKVTSVGAVILNNQGRVLVVHKKWTGHWEFPQGMREHGEKYVDTMRREIKEEVGITKYRIDQSFKSRMFYAFRFLGKHPVKKTVIFYLLHVQTSKVRLSGEHMAYQWCTFPQAMKKFNFENHRHVMRQVKRHLKLKTK